MRWHPFIKNESQSLSFSFYLWSTPALVILTKP